ncbi:MAG: ComEC/Rec2 family competence protein, partial [Paludibacteraceae bacterium]|nr:ComEC/Rec2 family competence protein [Paludibacteraceae bacterium]
LIKTTLSKPQYLNNPNNFDYADYLYKKRFYTTSYITQNQWILIGKNQSFQIKKWSNNIRNHLLNIYKKYGLTNDTFAIASAISLGYKDELSEEIKEQFSQSGASHILAVSGLHVGIIFLVISKILYPFNRNKHLRLLKLIIILLLLWGYALITGLSASVVRSTIMFSIIALGTTLKRNSNIYNSISIAAFFMLIYNPFYLLDISFQLSFSAVIGIVFIEKKIENLLTPKNKLGQACWTLICVSIASQLATLPFTIYYFHQFPNYFILTNLFVIFLTTFIVYTAITLLIISPITNLASIFGLLFKYEIRLLNFIVKFISDLPHSHTKNLWINPLETLMLALFIYCFIFFVFYKKNRHFHYALMCLIIYFISRNIQLYHQLHHPQIIVYSNKNEPCIQFINQNTSLTFYQNEISKRNSSLNTISRHKLNNKFVLTNNQCILLNGKYNVIANQNLNFSIPENWSKKPINLLIINKINAEEFKKYLNFLVPNKVIINHGISKKQNDKIKQICRSQNIDYHSIEENGAFIAYE